MVGREEGDTCDARTTMAAQVANQLSSGHRVGDDGETVEVECFDEGRQVIGKGVGVITAGGVIGTSVPAAIDPDAAITLFGERDHLVVPHLDGHPGAVQKENGGTASGTPLCPVEPCPVASFYAASGAAGVFSACLVLA